MTEETRTRFLAAIAAQIPAERVKEVHLFGAIRQGGTESGVAVIALERDEPVTLDVDGGYVPPAAVADAAPVETPVDVVVHDQLDDEARFVADEVADDVAEDVADVLSPVPAEQADPRPVDPPARYTVYTARYRHTLKGLDRGKWEISVTEEADAPLLTVDAVVRGVSRRSGEADDTERLSGDEFRAALPEPARA
jgi:hypothetical protein